MTEYNPKVMDGRSPAVEPTFLRTYLLRGLLVGSFGTLLALLGHGDAIGQLSSPEDKQIVEPALEPPSGSTSAVDLQQLNPNPELLDRPQTATDVKIDINAPITLEQAIELAKRNNRALQVTELELKRSREELREARAALFPSLSAVGNLARTDSATARISIEQQEAEIQADIEELRESLPSLSPVARLLALQTLDSLESQLAILEETSTVTNVFNASVQLSYDVFTSGQRDASIKAAEAAVEAAEQALETELQDLRLNVSNDYFDMQLADATVEIAQSSVTQSEISLRDAQALERAGLGTRFDVLTAEVQLANNQQDLTQALSQQFIARRALAEQLSLNPMATLAAADPVEIIGLWPKALETSIVLALQNRSELEEVLAQRQIARQNRRIALGSLGPQISIAASVTVADELDDNVLGNFGNSQGVEISKTIYDGGAAKAIARQQVLNEKIAEAQFADFKNTIRFQVEQNYFTLYSSFENIQTNQRAVEQAEESLRLARLRFQAGIGTQQEVITAERDLTTAQSNLLSAVIDYNRALVSLQRFVGSRVLPPATSQRLGY